MARQRARESAQSRLRARVTGGHGAIYLQGTHVVKMTLPLHPTIQKAWVAGKLTRVNEDGTPYQGDHYELPGKAGRAAPPPPGDGDDDALERPRPNASRATWAHYAVAIGACTEDEASQLPRDQLIILATAPEDQAAQ